MDPVYNFCAGPAMLPSAVLQKVQAQLCNWQNLGRSVMEISHRDELFLALVAKAEQNLRTLLSIPENYHVLYAHGGARGQFAAVPLNLLGDKPQADYVNSGYWAQSAIAEAKKYCTPNEVEIRTTLEGKKALLAPSQWRLDEKSAYVHFCSNETIDGVEISALPSTYLPIVADMSSNILSKPLDVSKFGVIYAGAQKNIGPAGLTLVLVRDDLLGKVRKVTPSILDYSTLVAKESMFNTPPTFAWYLAGEVYEWLLAQGGLAAVELRNAQKAALLYDAIDSCDFYHNNVHASCRSRMNVPFTLSDSRLDALFLQKASAQGLVALKGHRDAGGMRASIYNAMPYAGVQALANFMHEFAKENG
ncbi:MAG: 3-phosphoserine/phosphohydroxythreonine transaminase [Vibrionaceae bacterium]